MKSNQWFFEFSEKFIEHSIIVGNIYSLCYGSTNRFTLIPLRWFIWKRPQFTLLLPLHAWTENMVSVLLTMSALIDCCFAVYLHKQKYRKGKIDQKKIGP